MSEEWRAQRPKKPKDTPRTEYTAADWLLQMKLAEKRNDKWERRCKKIIKRYRNQHFDDSNEGAKDRRGMNVLWYNVETLSPSIYGREPVPICERRFLDKDVVGRVASQILERALRYEMGDSGFNDTVEQNIKDYLLVGRGVPWLRYKPVIGQATSLADRGDDDLSGQDGTDGGERTDDADEPVEAEDRDGDEPTDETPQEKLLAAGLEIDYVHWTDFFTSNARVWKQTEWVARRFFPSRDDLCDDFGDEIGNAVPLEMAPDHEDMRDGGRAIEEAPDSQAQGDSVGDLAQANAQCLHRGQGLRQIPRRAARRPAKPRQILSVPETAVRHHDERYARARAGLSRVSGPGASNRRSDEPDQPSHQGAEGCRPL